MNFEYPQDFWDRADMLVNDKQANAVEKLVQSRGGIVWWKVGEGKTRIGLFIFASLQTLNKWSLPSVCLIICRRRAFYDWRSEINLCFPSASIYEDQIVVHPPSRQPCFLLVSHAELEKREADLQANKLIRFTILDELYFYSNNKSKRSKVAYRLTSGRKSVGLSGTIMKARDLCEIYNQAKVVQKHRLLADNLTKFRGLHLKEKWIGGESANGFPMVFTKRGAYQKVMQDLESATDVHFPKGDRQIHEQFHTIPATKEQLVMFRELKEFMSIEAFDIEYNHAIVTSIKAQQIANGWLKTDKGEIVSVPSFKAAKLEDELDDILSSGERAVVWCAFRYDVEMLADRLKFTSLQMLGGEDFDIDRWQHGDVRLCLATEASGSSVNYFAQTPFAIYFSANYKWLDMQQSRGRHDRKSSHHSDCFYKYLQVEKSLDSHVYNVAMESGRREAQLIMQAGVSNWLKEMN